MTSSGNQNILWIDCEMTGLHPYLRPEDLPADEEFLPDRILEIAAIVTNKDLEALDDGIELVVRTEQSVLDKMNPWCIDQHGRSGLTSKCLLSSHSLASIDTLLCTYLTTHFPSPKMILLAGNSVHADKAFLAKDLPKMAAMLHYRILDVSTIKELAKRWFPDCEVPRKRECAHRALSDIQDSIAELKYYREKLFVPSS